jgi:hypothetical protein
MQELLEPGTMAHICNPSYSEGRDQEDSGSKAVRETLSQKNPTQKRVVASI